MKLGRCGNVLDGSFGALVWCGGLGSFRRLIDGLRRNFVRNATVYEGEKHSSRGYNLIATFAGFMEVNGQGKNSKAKIDIRHNISLRNCDQKGKERRKTALCNFRSGSQDEPSP